jgi:hypothetical protein
LEKELGADARSNQEVGEAEPFNTGIGWDNLSCDDQYALARRIASNVGYVLVPEAEMEPSPETLVRNAFRAIADARREMTLYQFTVYVHEHLYDLGGSGFVKSIGMAVVDAVEKKS